MNDPTVKMGDTVRSLITEATVVEGSTYLVVGVEPMLIDVKNESGDIWYLYHDEYEIVDPETGCPVGYPDDNPKTAVGLTKPPFHVIPPSALVELGQAMKDGKAKYGLMNWRNSKVSSSVYFDAAMRHLLAWWDGEDTASDSGVHHLSHAMACMAILTDARHQGTLNDDRPTAGPTANLIKTLTEAA